VPAQIIHSLPGRTRLRVLEKRRDEAFFADTIRSLTHCPGVSSIETNSLTGGILIHHDVPWNVLVTQIEQRTGLVIEMPRETSIAHQVAQGLETASQDLNKVSGGKLDWNTLLFLGLTGLAIQQAVEGNIMAPAVSLLWYALNSLPKTRL